MSVLDPKSKLPVVIVVGLAVVTAYASVLLGRDVSFTYYYGLIPAAVLGMAAYLLFRRFRHYRRLQELRDTWGKSVKKKRDFQSIRRYFDLIQSEEAGDPIDDRTWHDLNMDDIFAKIDRTLSTPGQQVLYSILRHPLVEAETLANRGSMLRFFQEAQHQRGAVQIVLDRLGESQSGVLDLLFDEIRSVKTNLLVYNALFLLALFSVASVPLAPSWGAQLVAVVFVVNMITHYIAEKQTQGHFESIQYLAKLVECAQNLSSLEAAEMAEVTSILKQTTPKVAKLRRLGGSLGMLSAGGGDLTAVVAQYVSIFFLAEARNYCKAISIVQKRQQELRLIYQQVGYVDAMQAVASWRAGLSPYCEPQFLATKLSLEIPGLYHPLLQDPIPNDFVLQRKGVLITGSNMSGKSTFLRAVGINALLAQTVFTCPSKSFKGTFFKLATSIGRSDNVVEGTSYYLEEALALRRIIEGVHSVTTTLCIVDEIFRGTNSKERIAASHRVLEYLTERNCVVLAATHDLELVDLLLDSFQNHHFQETVGGTGLDFDYQLKDGPSTTTNAIALLRYMGYPEQIVEKSAEDVAAES